LIQSINLFIQTGEVVQELEQDMICLRDGHRCVSIRLTDGLNFGKKFFHLSDVIVLIPCDVKIHVYIFL